jgi:BirA family transcriptional regulator, biotin operon repressor / biotin---[acetyl-CoA-carboxylase] ligase
LLADAGAIEGDWLVALEQSEGRGRHGRQWQSPAGNFHGSTLVTLQTLDPPAPSLSLVSGLALIEAAQTLVPDAELLLKWPNDLLLGSAKLGGILLERSGDRVVAGFGANLAAAPEIHDRPTATLPSDPLITPQAFAPVIAASFARMLGTWRNLDTEAFANAWLSRAHPLGTPLSVHVSANEKIFGTFDGIEPGGALRLRLADGGVRVMHAGDVSLGQG